VSIAKVVAEEGGTRDAIGVMRCLPEKSTEFNQDLHVCFIDYKAVDRVNWKKLMEIFRDRPI